MALLTVNGVARAATDPDLKFSPTGLPIASVRAVASKSKKNDRDEWETVSEMWFSVTAFGALGEWMVEALSKGQQFNLLGEIYEEEWETSEGEKRKTLKVIANGINPIPRRDQQGGQQGQQRPQGNQQGGWNQPQGQPNGGGNWGAQQPQQGPPQGDPWGQPQQGGWGSPQGQPQYDPSEPPF